MTELTRFQRRLIPFQSPAFDFERASVALLSRLKQHRQVATPSFSVTFDVASVGSEWRDPPGFRMDAANRPGGHHG